MKKPYQPLLFIGLGLLFLGCDSSPTGYAPAEPAPVVPMPEVETASGSLLPLRKGNRWFYTLDIAITHPSQPARQTTNQMVYEVSKVEQTDQGIRGVIDVKVDDEIQDQQVWLVNDKGLYQAGGWMTMEDGTRKLVPYDPPLPAVIFPVKKGQMFEWTGTGVRPDGTVGPYRCVSKVLGEEPVDTEQGRMTAIAIRTNGTFDSKGNKVGVASTIWFRPDEGIVRFKQIAQAGKETSVGTLKLQSYDLPTQRDLK